MGIISIMTWNTGMTEWTKENYAERFDKVVNQIKEHLEKENSIAFLQQVPYKMKVESLWSVHPYFKELQKRFSEPKCKMFYNDTFNDGYIIMMTIAIVANKGGNEDGAVSANEKIYPNSEPTNRECAILYKNLNILGIHAKNGEDNKRYLEMLNSQADIILGDFNAGNYKEAENRFTFNSILQEHICICNTPTRIDPRSKRRTCIDHVFIREEDVTKCAYLVVHEEVTFSDHFPITFEVII